MAQKARKTEETEAYRALIRIQNELPEIKKEIRAMKKDFEELMMLRDIARDSLHLVINLIDRNPAVPLSKVKGLATTGLKTSKTKFEKRRTRR